jgi:uncharacterized membrane protein YgcG
VGVAEEVEVPAVGSSGAGTMKRLAVTAAAAAAAAAFWLALAGPAGAAPPAGPPYPDAVKGQRVYDYAGIFSTDTIAQAETTIAAIEQRTGAQVAVYTQVKPESDTLDDANADARALMDQWGVGRKGFDDGLVILFDMEPNLRHGQVSLYAGSGYRAAFLSDDDRQHVFDEDMKPLLAEGDMDGGLMAGLRAIDANATPEHARSLEQGRQINAIVAMAGLLIGLLLIGYVVASWLRHGRDPVYIDDRSILMPAPPPDLTPAMATLLLADRTSDRTTSAGLIDLAARGAIAFQMDKAHPKSPEMGIRYLGRARGVAQSEKVVLDAVRGKAHDGYISPARLYQLSDAFDEFRDSLESRAVERQWLTADPSSVVEHWVGVGGLETLAAIVVAFLWMLSAASALLVLALGLLAAGVVTLVLSGSMPARTRQGAMLYAMLAAYRRTLEATIRQAQSMGEVVKAKALPWVTTPDQVMAWGIAFGLNDELEAVLARSMAAPEGAEGAPAAAWQPSWWLMHPGSTHAGLGLTGPAGSSGSHGLFSASAIPDPGAIFAALGSITNASPPYTSSSGGSSGFSGSFGGGFGGGGGGGGGGAGGGF